MYCRDDNLRLDKICHPCINESPDSGSMHMISSRYFGLAHAFIQHHPNIPLTSGELDCIRPTSHRSSQHRSFLTATSKGLPSALTDKVSLDFRRQAKGEGKNLALDIVAKPVSFLDAPYAASLAHALVEHVHDHEETASESGQLGAYDQVTFLYRLKQFTQFTLAHSFGAADGLLDPAIHLRPFRLNEPDDFKPLVLHGLFVAAHSDVPIDHGSYGADNRTISRNRRSYGVISA